MKVLTMAYHSCGAADMEGVHVCDREYLVPLDAGQSTGFAPCAEGVAQWFRIPGFHQRSAKSRGRPAHRVGGYGGGAFTVLKVPVIGLDVRCRRGARAADKP